MRFARSRDSLALYAGLLFVLALVGTYEVLYGSYIFKGFGVGDARLRPPIYYDHYRKINYVEEEARQAGIRVDDFIEKVADADVTNSRVVENIIQSYHPGDRLSLTIRHSAAVQPLRVEVTVVREPTRSLELRSLIILGILNLGLPALCLGLGFSAVILRIRNPLSWLLLALTISLSLLIVEPGWSGPFATAAVVYQTLAEDSLGIWVLLFGTYFPERGFAKNRKWVNWRWLLIAPLAALTLVFAYIHGAETVSFKWSAPLYSWIPYLRPIFLSFTAASGTACIVLLFYKARAARGSDSARRLRILLAGTAFSFGPLLALIIAGIVRGVPALYGAPLWLDVVALLLLAVFPATVLYLILVYRVLDLRVVARESLKYTLLGRGVVIIRTAVIAVSVTIFLLRAHGTALSWSEQLPFVLYPLILLLVLHPRLVRRVSTWLDARLFQDVHESERGLERLSDDLWTYHDSAELLGAIRSGISKWLEASAVFVLTGDGETAFATSPGDEFNPVLRLSADGETASILRRSDRPLEVYFDDPRSWVTRTSPDERTILHTLRAMLLVPLVNRGRLQGIISMGSKTGNQGYSASETGLLQSFAKQASHALENCVLIAQLQKEVSDREHAHAEKLAAEEANRSKTAFLASMSHELRTPLNAILGYSEMLRETAEEIRMDEMVQDLERIHTAGRHLLSLINSVLDLSKIEGGRMELYLETVRIDRLVEDVVTIVRPLVTKNGNGFDYFVEREIGLAELDSTKVRQCLFNLLSNAAKFTSNGTVMLKVTRVSDGEDRKLRFEVQDSGIGINKEQMTRLFQPFSQADASISQKYGGTGLGLALSRRFCQLMGGDIQVESTPGQGSTFTMEIPMRTKRSRPGRLQTDQRVASGQTGSQNGPTVLVIDDDVAVQDLLSRWLNREGLRTVAAYDGKQGLAKAKEMRPDVITLDIMMVDEDGWTTLAALKSDPELAGIPIIMLTIVDDKETGFCLGASDYLTKPVDRSQLISVLAKFQSGANQKHALIIDDDPATRQHLRSILASLGWKVTEAGTGQEGLASLETVAPNMIILDLMMPEMDGFEFLEIMRRNSKWHNIPVLVVTAKELTEKERVWLESRVHLVLDNMRYGREDFFREVSTRIRSLTPS